MEREEIGGMGKGRESKEMERAMGRATLTFLRRRLSEAPYGLRFSNKIHATSTKGQVASDPGFCMRWPQAPSYAKGTMDTGSRITQMSSEVSPPQESQTFTFPPTTATEAASWSRRH